MDTVELPDPNDRHVVAAAVVGRADVIVTDNRVDFPAHRLPSPLCAQTADTFLVDLHDLHPQAAVDALYTVAARSGRRGPARSVVDLVSLLGERGCVRFAEAVTPSLG